MSEPPKPPPLIAPHPANVHPIPSDGRRPIGPLEAITHRYWEPGTVPEPRIVTSIDRLASFPAHLTGRLLEGLEAIHIGAGPITAFPGFTRLHDLPVDPDRPQGPRWQHIPGAYWNRRIAVGTHGLPLTYDVLLHEIMHALDELDDWISGSGDFRALHWSCTGVLVEERYIRQPAEFFAEAGTLTYLRAWSRLERLLGGATERAYNVRSWYLRTYGIGG